jgi:hypothetical protein
LLNVAVSLQSFFLLLLNDHKLANVAKRKHAKCVIHVKSCSNVATSHDGIVNTAFGVANLKKSVTPPDID